MSPTGQHGEEYDGSRRGAGDRFRLLYEQLGTLTDDLSVPTVAAHIADAARVVLSAGLALVVLTDDEGRTVAVARSGRDHTRTAVLADRKPLPQFAELLEHLSSAATSVEVGELTIGATCFGHLIAADFAPGAPGAPGPDTQKILEAVCRSAASALRHATLVRRERASARWLHASGEIARAMLADADIDAFTEIVARAVEAAEADYGHIVVPTRDGLLVVLAAHGTAANHYVGALHEADTSDLTRAVANGKTLLSPDLSTLTAGEFDDVTAFGPVMLAPLLDALGTRGSVLLARVGGSPEFTEADLDQFATYAAQVALAMQFADARIDSERLHAVEARADLAREIGDVVMQRLFAVGLGLESLIARLDGTTHQDSLEQYVVDLDATIEEIRTRIFLGKIEVHYQPGYPRIDLPPDARATRSTGRGRRRSDWADGQGTAVF